MQQDLVSTKTSQPSLDSLHCERVCFDGENACLEGTYGDELSAHRAKRIWVDTLLGYFLLEKEQDIRVRVLPIPDGQLFKLKCEFTSACARYAFWRLTNGQTPEVQYLIETAHVPQSENRWEELIATPDMKPVERPEPFMLSGQAYVPPRSSPNLLGMLVNWLKRHL